MTLEAHGLKFHHFGLAVRDVSGAMTFLKGMGYNCGKQIHDPLQKVMLAWCDHLSMPAIELVSPSDEAGPLDNILAGDSERIYHLCYSSRDILESVSSIKASGIRVLPVAEPKPAVLFGGKLVGFYQARGFGLIEIVEED
jgi:methylmalonyl-CoA/ethylmalonyl-CoA epimerase